MYKHIPLEEETIYYPVGPYIQRNTATIKNMAKILKKEYPKRSLVFWVRGSSGAMIAAMISGFLRSQACTIHYIRKSGEDSHGGSDFEDIEDGINIIVDDFMSTGNTVRVIFEELRDQDQTLDCLCLSSIVWLDRIDDILSANTADNLVIICNTIQE